MFFIKRLLRCYSEFILVYISVLPMYLYVSAFIYLFIYLFTVFSNQCFMEDILIKGVRENSLVGQNSICPKSFAS